ncbi:MAG TPA: YbaB/EbfC family nucleoid-associated protein [Clostridia bacterium]|nr:YbaB/EbfC family nucleoid-associated protein [Clostridia bacterium]
MARGGFPGMGGNMNNLMKQAKKMQAQMEKMQAELEEKTVEASAGGGVVTVIVNGKKEIIEITIDEAVVDPDDVEMLQDLIMAATNEALRQAEELMQSEMGKITGGMGGLPGMF